VPGSAFAAAPVGLDGARAAAVDEGAPGVAGPGSAAAVEAALSAPARGSLLDVGATSAQAGASASSAARIGSLGGRAV